MLLLASKHSPFGVRGQHSGLVESAIVGGATTELPHLSRTRTLTAVAAIVLEWMSRNRLSDPRRDPNSCIVIATGLAFGSATFHTEPSVAATEHVSSQPLLSASGTSAIPQGLPTSRDAVG